MRRLGILTFGGVLLLWVGQEVRAGPFVDSVIVASKTFGGGSVAAIEVMIHNDSALSGFTIPFVITSRTGGAFGTVDSVKYLLSKPQNLTVNLTRIRGGSPDSLFMLWIDFSGDTIPSGTRRDVVRMWVTNNAICGTYSLDSNRLNSSNRLRFSHPTVQSGVPAYVRGIESLSGSTLCLGLANYHVFLHKSIREVCVNVGGAICDSATQAFTIDSVKVQHRGDPDLSCSTAVGATALVGQTAGITTCVTDSGRGFLTICAAPTASHGDTGTCGITFFGTLPGAEVGAPAQSVALSGSLSMVASSTAVSVVPTLTQWGLALFGVLLAGMLGYVYFRRRRVERFAT